MEYSRKIPLMLVAGTIAFVAAFVLFRAAFDDQDRPPLSSGGPSHEEPPDAPDNPQAMVDSPIRFMLLPHEQTGIDFEYYGSPSDRNYMTEQNGGGVALFDADGDGQLDVFLSNGSHFDKPAETVGAGNRLFRQIGELQFEDVTLAAGLQDFGFGQGCAAGDFDNDGFVDLFVAKYGTNRLWQNNGDGTFTEVTREAGLGDDRWGTSAAFADLDGDGNLDLYVVNYVDWTPDRPGDKRIPSPMDFNGVPDLLYRNLGDGRFRDVGTEAGISLAEEGKGLAVAIGDLDGDRRPDIYVANDTTRNFYFRNLGGMRFEEIGIPSGCAVSQDGSIGSGMGVAVSDYNGDGKPDLFVTNFAEEVVDVFTNNGTAGFIADNSELGVDAASRRALNFGIVAADFDLDFWPDLFFANGHLWDDTAAGGEYRMRPNLLRNASGKKFTDVSSAAGSYFQQRWLGRAVARGDLDNDGDTDLVVGHLSDRTAVLRNDSDRAGGSVRVQLIGTTASRQPLGARVTVEYEDRTTRVTCVPSGESFQAAHDPVLVVATGKSGSLPKIRIDWPGGSTETWELPAETPDGTVRLIEGRGRTAGMP